MYHCSNFTVNSALQIVSDEDDDDDEKYSTWLCVPS